MILERTIRPRGPYSLALSGRRASDPTRRFGNGVRPQALVGAACAFVAAYISTKFLVKFFETRSLLPFGVYCLVAGGLCILRFA